MKIIITKIIKYIIPFFLLLYIFTNKTNANEKIEIQNNFDDVNVNETFNLNLKTNMDLGVLTMYIYYDTSVIENINKSDNTNYSNNRLIYTKLDVKENEEILLEFKKLKDEYSNIYIELIGYSNDLKKVDLDSVNMELKKEYIQEDIDDEEENSQQTTLQSTSNDATNTKLQILRLNHEGISPSFNAEIYNYYMIVEDINKIDITAIAQNMNASVQIQNNDNIQNGENKIIIEVTSEDINYKTQYVINVTKTNNIKESNANLENLAIRDGELEPVFIAETTNYKVEVSNETQNTDILAISQDINASVNIQQPEELKIGNNNVIITVTAQNKTTKKVYNLNIYRRSKEEETKYIQIIENNIVQLEAVLENQEDIPTNNQKNQEMQNIKEEEEKTMIISIWACLGIIAAACVIGFICYKYKENHKIIKN